jgi:hypothetical protein
MSSVDADLRSGRRLETGRRSESIIYTPYAGAAGMLLHINGKFTMGKLKSSLLS